MTIDAATLMWSRDGGSISSSDGIRLRATITEAYQVTADPVHKSPEIFDAPGLPRISDLFPGVPGLYCTDKRPQRVSPILWIVEVTYTGEGGPGGIGDNPINAPPEITWTDTETTEEIDEDFDGNPIVTANREPITGLTTTIADQILQVKRNFLTINTYAIREYRRSVNSDTFLNWPPGTARLTGYSAKLVHAEPVGFWEVNARFQFREPFRTTAEKAWYARVRHEGNYIKVGADIVRAVDDNKEPTVKPVLLKSDGTLETNPAAAHWLEWKRYQPLPYNALGLA